VLMLSWLLVLAGAVQFDFMDFLMLLKIHAWVGLVEVYKVVNL
jgi:hypothetical protein